MEISGGIAEVCCWGTGCIEPCLIILSRVILILAVSPDSCETCSDNASTTGVRSDDGGDGTEHLL